MLVYCVRAWYPRRPEDGITSPGTGVLDSCEPPGGWQSNLGHLVLLTAGHLSSLCSSFFFFLQYPMAFYNFKPFEEAIFKDLVYCFRLRVEG